MNLKYTVLLLFLSFSAYTQNSILSDKQALQKIDESLDSLYNFKFENVKLTEQELYSKYPDNPLPPLFSAMKIYWEHFPVTTNSSFHDIYVQKINQSIEISEKLLEKNDDDSEAIFLNLMARMLIMQYYADNNQSSKVIPYISRAYSMVKKGFNLTDEIIDFNFSTGLYNYYRKAYPERYPVYKPIAYFFKGGDKKLGLKQLEYNWKHGIFLDAESLSFLVFISLNFEGDYKKSLKYTRDLYKEYPDNPLYLSYRIRTLLLLNRYNKAQDLLVILNQKSQNNDFFQMMYKIYQGIVEEKKNHKPEKAKELYLEAIELGKKYETFANDRLSYAYFGLSRVVKTENPELSKKYRSKAVGLSNYKHLTFD